MVISTVFEFASPASGVQKMRFLLIALFAASTIAQFTDYTPQSYPNSQINPTCGLPEPAYVCDPSGVLSKENGSLITMIHKLVEVQSQTRCVCDELVENIYGHCDGSGLGFIISVAFTHKMVLNDDEKDRDTIFRAAKVFADKLRIRQARGHCQDDILIFLSKDDNVVSTSVGEATARFLTNEMIMSVTTHAEEFSFKKEKYADGINYMIDTYVKVLNGEKVKVVETNHWYSPLPLWAIITIFVVVGIILLIVIGMSIYCCAKHCCCSDGRGRYAMTSNTSRM